MNKSMPHLFPHCPLLSRSSLELGDTERSSKGFSLSDKILDREQNLGVFVVGEHEAKLYEERLEKDTLKVLDNAVHIAGVTLDLSEELSEEVGRQGDVIDQANDDIRKTEQEIDESHLRLSGMKSIPSKIANVLWYRKSKVQLYDDIV